MQKRLPLWIGGGGEKRTLRTTARYADGWNLAYVAPQVFRHKNRVLSQWCEKEGRDPATLARTVNLGFYLKTDDAAAQAERRGFFTQWGPMAQMMEGGMLFGTPKQAVDRVGQYLDAGASRVTIALARHSIGTRCEPMSKKCCRRLGASEAVTGDRFVPRFRQRGPP